MNNATAAAPKYDRRKQYAYWLADTTFTLKADHRGLRAGDQLRVTKTMAGLECWYARRADGTGSWLQPNQLTY